MVERNVVKGESVKNVLVSEPITNDLVFKGRCTLCFPLPPEYSGLSSPKNSEQNELVLDKSHWKNAIQSVNGDGHYEGNSIMSWFSCT
mmetsp:Transcript_9946/g.14549  ORF Transcript_9946/g.14549 Transcript_9946/m.14549 type:complete len:88 (+) Transcript_9946:3-266(+)